MVPVDEAEAEFEDQDSIEEIFIPEDSSDDVSPNITSNELSSNPLNISTEVNVGSDDVSIENTMLQTTTNESSSNENISHSLTSNDSLHQERSADENTCTQEIATNNSAVTSSSNNTQMSSVNNARDKDESTSESNSSLNHDEQNVENSTVRENGADHSVIDGPSVDNVHNEDISSNIIDDIDNAFGFDQVENENCILNETDQPEVKPNVVPMYEIHRANNTDILNQLEDWMVVYTDDDIEITVSSKGYGEPLGTTLDGLVKPEKPDDFSGMMPCLNTVI